VTWTSFTPRGFDDEFTVTHARRYNADGSLFELPTDPEEIVISGSNLADVMNVSDGATGLVWRGGLGDDTYLVSSGSNNVIENAGEGTDTVSSAVSYTLGSNLENLVLTGVADSSGTITDCP